MQLIYVINISEENYNIVRGGFETGSVNVIINRSLVAKKHRKFKYIYQLGSVYQKTMKIVTKNNNNQNVREPDQFVTNS